MKALILAAGFGSRLMPLTQNEPKCMVKYKEKRLIDYEIEALKEAGIKEIAVVGGYLFEVLKDFLRKNHGIEKIYRNENFDKTNMVSTLFCAREFLQTCIEENEDLIISYADIVYFKNTILKLKEEKDDFAIVVDKAWRKLWEKRFKNPLEDAETLKFQGSFIKELGKKPQNYSEIQAQYTGLFKFSASFLPEVLSFYDSLDKSSFYDGKDFDNMYMTSFLQALIDNKKAAKAVEIYGNWLEVDFKKDLEVRL